MKMFGTHRSGGMILVILFSGSLFGSGHELPGGTPVTAADALLPVIPQPASWTPSGKNVCLEPDRTTFSIAADAELGEEGYEIRIASDGVKVSAPTERGLVWARQTMAQLKSRGGRLPAGVIRDRPKYRSRGFMLDVARTFVEMKFLRALVRDMAYYKFNLLHLHLNDDGPSYFLKDGYHAFRLECETYPDLTAKDGHYTKAEFRALVKEATALGVTVLPEFDTPWHAGCFRGVKALRDQGVDGLDLTRMDVVCPFIEKLWAEYLDGPDPVFPGKYVHVGTDEYPFDAELFRKYSDWIFGMVRRHGREPQAWGALTHKPGKTPVRADRNIVMDIWYSPYYKPDEALAAGYSVVSIPESLLYIVPAADYYKDYLDLPHLYANWEPANIGGTYHPYDMKADDPRLVGGKFALWNDICGNGISDDDMFDRIFSALQVLGEKMWRGKTARPWKDFAALAAATGEAPGVNLADRLTGPNGTPGTNDVAVGWSQGGYEVSFTLMPQQGPQREDMVLFDDGTSRVTLLGEDAGNRLAFSRDGYDHVFGARLFPWETRRVVFAGDAKGVTLTVDGRVAGSTQGLVHRYTEKAKDGKGVAKYKPVVRTLHFPLVCVAPAGRVNDVTVRIGCGKCR